MKEYNEWDLTPAHGIYDKEPEELVKLSCSCGFSFDKPISTKDAPMGFKAKNASWSGCYWKKMPRKGKKMVIYVHDPFCCKIGELFSMAMTDYDKYAGRSPINNTIFVVFRLLAVKNLEQSMAKILVKVIEIGDILQFVESTSLKEALKIKNTAKYNLDLEPGQKFVIFDNERNLYSITTSWGGGDSITDNIIYTDANGIDHLVCIGWFGLDEGRVFYGDTILGHKSHRNWAHLIDQSQSTPNSRCNIPKYGRELHRK